MQWYHVYPIKDLNDHITNGFECNCKPNIDYNSNIVIHNSFDCREIIEKENCNKNITISIINGERNDTTKQQ